MFNDRIAVEVHLNQGLRAIMKGDRFISLKALLILVDKVQ